MNSPATSAGARNCSIDTKRHAVIGLLRTRSSSTPLCRSPAIKVVVPRTCGTAGTKRSKKHAGGEQHRPSLRVQFSHAIILLVDHVSSWRLIRSSGRPRPGTRSGRSHGSSHSVGRRFVVACSGILDRLESGARLVEMHGGISASR
jgi:hypothetical protein